LKTFDSSKAGDVIEVRFRQVFPLQIGAYTLNFGCTQFVPEGLAVYHRLYDVMIFEVRVADRFVGYFNPTSEIEILPCEGSGSLA
jgi:hypothetical protein